MIKIPAPARWSVRFLQRNNINLGTLEYFGYIVQVGSSSRRGNQQLIQAVLAPMRPCAGFKLMTFRVSLARGVGVVSATAASGKEIRASMESQYLKALRNYR